jgi:hypothetical protein
MDVAQVVEVRLNRERGEPGLKKWIFPAATSALLLPIVMVIGCGGSGGGGAAAGTTAGTGNGDSVAVANIPNTPGQISMLYLTGQGRAVGDTIAILKQGPTVTDSTGTRNSQKLPDVLQLDLNGGVLGGTANGETITESTTAGNSHQYNNFELKVDQLGIEGSDGSVGSLVPSDTSQLAIDQIFPANIGAFPGRSTTVQVYLNDAIASVGSGVANFDRGLFLTTNTSTDNPNIQGFFSDFVMFDITNVASKPNLVDGTAATRVYFNGDRIGVSGSTSGGLFQIYTPAITLQGIWNNPTPPANLPTYTIKQVSPTDITQQIKITALQGTWKPATSAFSGLGTFEVLLFPHNIDAVDPAIGIYQDDMVVFTADATGKITNLYFGTADLTNKSFAIFPISQVETGGVSGEIDGTITALQDAGGNATTTLQNVRQGRYSFTGSLPTGFKTTGRFAVYRR